MGLKPKRVTSKTAPHGRNTQTSRFTLDSVEKLTVLQDKVAEALGSSDYTMIEFDSPMWKIPVELDAEDPPYKGLFHKIGKDEGEYDQGLSQIYVSSNPSGFLRGIDWGSHDAQLRALGFGEEAQVVPPEDAEKNARAKRAVVQVQFAEAGYFAHAIDNVFPRVISVWEGARKAGYNLSVVMPHQSRSFFSHSTEVMFSELGIELLEEYPTWPHRAVGVQEVSSWNHFLKRSLQLAFRSTILKSTEPARCGPDQAVQGAYLSRRHGARNGRWVQGSERVEDGLLKKGFKIYNNMGALDLKTFARELYHNVCTLAGFTGGGMLNLVFLPPRATVVDVNPTGIYADTWFNAHELNDGFVHIVPSSREITEEEADRIVSITTAANRGSTELAGLVFSHIYGDGGRIVVHASLAPEISQLSPQ